MRPQTYKRKLTLSFIVIFALFTAGIVVFEQVSERRYKTEALVGKLDAYADIADALAREGRVSDTLPGLLPSNLRLTLIAPDGTVAYDNLFGDPAGLENHSERPEVASAKESGSGWDIRTSASNSRPYLYYAKYFGDGVVRVALPYDIVVRDFLKADNGFLYFIIALFVVGLLLINYVGGRFGNSIRKLRDFSSALSRGDDDIPVPNFPSDELGEIGNQIVDNYRKLKSGEARLLLEREKLLQHIQSSAEGVCFFREDNTVEFYNGLFLQYLNVIGDSDDAAADMFAVDAFRPAYEFLTSLKTDNYFETVVAAHGKEFLLRLNRFEDHSFEIVLNDISSRQKTRRLKKEMTANIAHELRTPITSIRGYLETILETPLTDEQRNHFLEKAYIQTLTVSELIRDIGLLTRIEDSPSSFEFRPVRISGVIDKIEAELKPELDANGTVITRLFPADLAVEGNESLIYSVFRNLTDNVVKHAGRGAGIEIKELRTFGKFVYMTFRDTGKGVADETDLGRLFERFYRADEGRTRDTGGSGLGLSIVRNAVSIHGGSISVKRGTGGGIVFNFSLPKA